MTEDVIVRADPFTVGASRKVMTPNETDTDLLRTAVEQGYFKVPRQTSLVDLADAIDLSDVEASERLRTEVDTALRDYLGEVDATAASEEE